MKAELQQQHISDLKGLDTTKGLHVFREGGLYWEVVTHEHSRDGFRNGFGTSQVHPPAEEFTVFMSSLAPLDDQCLC